MNNIKQENLKYLVELYINGTANEEQRAFLERYYEIFSTQENILDGKDRKDLHNLGLKMKSVIDSRIDQEDKKIYNLFPKVTIAAAVLIAGLSVGFYFFVGNKQIESKTPLAARKIDISPGSNQASLELGDGSKVSLGNVPSGTLASEAGIRVHEVGNGSVVYDRSKIINTSTVYHTITTPRGGQYRVQLSDGTGVWLNADSKLRYPVVFGSGLRKVFLSGEAYFEVSKDAKRPFLVETVMQDVEVLGTHFNVSAYEDEGYTSTSLTEGKVKVTVGGTGHILLPGQQAISLEDSKTLNVLQVDTVEAIAWKNGYFYFQDEPLKNILQKISRWYDVDISYSGNGLAPNLAFSGTVSRYGSAAQVLRKLELTGGVRFRIEGRRIVVLP